MYIYIISIQSNNVLPLFTAKINIFLYFILYANYTLLLNRYLNLTHGLCPYRLCPKTKNLTYVPLLRSIVKPEAALAFTADGESSSSASIRAGEKEEKPKLLRERRDKIRRERERLERLQELKDLEEATETEKIGNPS